MEAEYKLRVIVFREGDWWVAQILEHNLATAARSLDLIPAELERFLAVQIVGSLESGIKPFEDLPPAPKRFWDLYDQAAEVVPEGPRILRFPAATHATASVDARIAA